jgi:hypothetical protein
MVDGIRITGHETPDLRGSGSFGRYVLFRTLRAAVSMLVAVVLVTLIDFPYLEWNQKCSEQWDFPEYRDWVKETKSRAQLPSGVPYPYGDWYQQPRSGDPWYTPWLWDCIQW